MLQIEAVLAGLEIKYADSSHRHGRSGWVQVCCPDCDNGAEKFHLGIRLSDCRANCWQCGPKSLPRVLTQVASISWKEAQSALKGVLPRFAPSDGKSARKQQASLPDGCGALKRAHREYLEGRGFCPDELCRLWGIRGLAKASSSAMDWRVVIPIMHKSRLASWTARSINDHPLRYLSCPDKDEAVPHKSILFGGDYVTSRAILHEGPLDVMATGPGAVATFGIGFTLKQIARLCKLKRLVVCFDSQAKAQQRAQQIIDLLEPYPVEVFNVTIDAKDPAEALRQCPKELRALRRLAFGRNGM